MHQPVDPQICPWVAIRWGWIVEHPRAKNTSQYCRRPTIDYSIFMHSMNTVRKLYTVSMQKLLTLETEQMGHIFSFFRSQLGVSSHSTTSMSLSFRSFLSIFDIFILTLASLSTEYLRHRKAITNLSSHRPLGYFVIKGDHSGRAKANNTIRGCMPLRCTNYKRIFLVGTVRLQI